MYRAFVFLLLLCLSLAGNAEQPVWTSRDERGQIEVHLYFFWSLNCPHCLDARPQILDLASQHAWLRVHDHELTQSQSAVRVGPLTVPCAGVWRNKEVNHVLENSGGSGRK